MLSRNLTEIRKYWIVAYQFQKNMHDVRISTSILPKRTESRARRFIFNDLMWGNPRNGSRLQTWNCRFEGAVDGKGQSLSLRRH